MVDTQAAIFGAEASNGFGQWFEFEQLLDQKAKGALESNGQTTHRE